MKRPPLARNWYRHRIFAQYHPPMFFVYLFPPPFSSVADIQSFADTLLLSCLVYYYILCHAINTSKNHIIEVLGHSLLFPSYLLECLNFAVRKYALPREPRPLHQSGYHLQATLESHNRSIPVTPVNATRDKKKPREQMKMGFCAKLIKAPAKIRVPSVSPEGQLENGPKVVIQHLLGPPVQVSEVLFELLQPHA